MDPFKKANELVEAIKASQQVQEYTKIKNEIYKDEDCKNLIKEFRDKQVEVQSLLMQGQEADQEKMEKLQSLYQILVSNGNVKDFFDKEIQFDEMLAEIYRIIGEGVKDIHE